MDICQVVNGALQNDQIVFCIHQRSGMVFLVLFRMVQFLINVRYQRYDRHQKQGEYGVVPNSNLLLVRFLLLHLDKSKRLVHQVELVSKKIRELLDYFLRFVFPSDRELDCSIVFDV